jgi:glycosyltransferase involved in cell wall biosynthesis
MDVSKNEIAISVILPVYNGELYLKEAIDSILFQTFKHFELIIINDGSTDATAAIISAYQDPRIVYFENEVNQKLVYCLNLGLSKCRGKYIARMDADDIAMPQRLQIQYDFMESHPETGICGGSVALFDLAIHKEQRVDFSTTDREIRAFAFFQSPFNHPSVMIRKEIITVHRLKYPSEYYRAEDYALWIELLKYTKAANVSAILMRYRKHEGSETAIADKHIEDRIQVVMRVQQKYLTQYDITLDTSEMRTYTLFTDRSFPCELHGENQKAVENALKNFLHQLSQKQKVLLPDVLHHLSIICFYKFFKSRKFPCSLFLQKLFFRGFVFYCKKLFLGRKI